MKRPRLNNLRSFSAAGRHLSFSKAAAELNITQAAVSQQIRQLEQALGAPLFVRHHRSLSLTPVGQTYHRGVQRALGRLDNLTDQLFIDLPNTPVKIKCTSSVAILWLAPKIRAFQKAYPKIDLQIITQDTEGQGEGSAPDLEVFVSQIAEVGEEYTPLLTSVITPVAAPAYLAENRPHKAEDLLRHDLIHILGYEEDWQRWFAINGVSDVAVPQGLAGDSSLFAIDAARRGEGVFLGRRPFIDSYLERGELVEVFGDLMPLHACYYLRTKGGVKNARNRRVVSKWLIELDKSGY